MEVEAHIRDLKLAGLEIKGGFSLIRLDLPAPSGVVPIHKGKIGVFQHSQE